MLDKTLLGSFTNAAKIIKPDKYIHQVRVFNLQKDVDKRELEDLLNSGKSIFVHDELKSQLQELHKIRNPERRLKNADFEEFYRQWSREHDHESYGCWVYYPWSHKLVHLVSEEEFIELRTSRNKYKLTLQEQETLRQKTVGVIGLSVGQSVSVTMAIERSFGRIKIADFDVLELTNLNRIRRGVDSLGLQKTVMVAREIAEIDPFLQVEVFEEGITEDNIEEFLGGEHPLDLLIEECDSLDIKILSRLRAREKGIPVVMDTSDRGMIDIERFDLEPQRPLFHGLVDEKALKNLKGLSTEEKIPFILKMVGVEDISKRFKASMLEVEQSITTWPQLSTSVTMGGAFAGDVGRRILLNQLHISGRFYIDIEDQIADPPKDRPKPVPPLGEYFDLEELRQKVSEYALPPMENSVELREEEIEDLVEHGSHAPSGGNVQPWMWIYRNHVLYLFHHPGRSHSFLDYQHRGSYIALGAAIENVYQRSASLGLEAHCDIRVGDFPQLIAQFQFVRNSYVSPLSHANHGDFIKQRLTNRKFGDKEQKLEERHKEDFYRIAAEEPFMHFKLIEDKGQIESMAGIIAGMERLRLLNPWGHHDFINETRWSEEEARKTRDGIDLATLEMTESDKAGLSLLRDPEAIAHLRNWNKGEGFIKMMKKAPVASSALGFLYADKHTKDVVINGGRILQRMWLHANHLGISLQPVSPATFMFYRLISSEHSLDDKSAQQMEIYYRKFREILSLSPDTNDLFLFRLFYADKPKVLSYRYPLNEVLRIN